MAQFKAFNDKVEVNGETIMSFINSMNFGKENREQILKSHGIIPVSGTWYKQQNWLDAFKELHDNIGQINLYLIGKAIISNANFPSMNSLKDGLLLINVAYHMNHRLDGKIMYDPSNHLFIDGIGSYELRDFNEKARTATMVCNNPYPSKFDEGIIMEIVQRFKPYNSIVQEIKIDNSVESRINGGESCTYLINW